MSQGVILWRIAVEGRDYPADDLSGKGAEITGGRWNRPGLPMIYTSESIALAYLETLVHLEADRSLPLNRYLVRLSVAAPYWEARTVFDCEIGLGWDAEPYGFTSLEWGNRWLVGKGSLLAEVPSVIVPEESNILINPCHEGLAAVKAQKVRRWTYDQRFRHP